MRHVPLTTLFLALLLAHGFLSPLQAKELINVNGMYYVSSGKYYVGEDKNGVYLRTDEDAFWYLDGDDLGAFKPGESGIYYLEKDTNKPYILTDKKRVFYISQEEIVENLKKERSDSVADSEIREVIKGFDKLFTNSYTGGLYATKAEARRGIKGQATIEWERKKAEDEARKRAEEEARIRAEEEARKRALIIRAIHEAAEARRAAEEARLEAEVARREAESRSGRMRIGIDLHTGKGVPIYIPPD